MAGNSWILRSDTILVASFAEPYGSGLSIMTDNQQVHLWRHEAEWLRDELTAILAGEKKAAVHGDRLTVDDDGKLIPPTPVARPAKYVGHDPTRDADEIADAE